MTFTMLVQRPWAGSGSAAPSLLIFVDHVQPGRHLAEQRVAGLAVEAATPCGAGDE